MTFENYLRQLSNRRVAVVGAGISNVPLIDRLIDAGAHVAVRDSKEAVTEHLQRFKDKGAHLILGEKYLDDLHEEVIFRTPGLMPHNHALQEAVRRGSILTSEMEVFFEVCPCRIFGVTGSDGKTTTTSIIAEVLKRQGLTVHIGGNIGTPLLCNADSMKVDDFAVVELSSFQLISMRCSPDVAVVTNLTPNHLNVHRSFTEYVQAKRNIYLHQKQGARAVFNADDTVSSTFGESALGGVRYFSLDSRPSNGTYLEGKRLMSTVDGEICTVDDILLPGMHNVANYLAAFAALEGFARIRAMQNTARSFRGVQHRLELVREHNGVKYYNDSIATSPTRAIAGLKSFERKVILIAGGADKGMTFKEFGDEINKRVKKLVLTGSTSYAIKDSVISSERYKGLGIFMCETFDEAVNAASKLAESGDIVLLSPACTSFDMFENFERRGEKFREIVYNLQ